MRWLTSPLLVVCALVVFSSGALAAGQNDREDVVVEAPKDKGQPATSDVGLNAWLDAGAVDLGPDPYAGCAVFANLTNVDVGVLTGSPVSEDSEIDDEVYVLIRCSEAFIRWWPEGDPVPAEVLNLLVLSARSRVPIVPPEPSMSPDGASFPFITQLPVWFWVDDAAWVPVSASASIAQLGLTVTVTATPSSVLWSPGDGSPAVECGQGTPWNASLPADAVSDCQHVYTAALSADDGPLLVTNQVTYGLGLSCAPVGLCANASIPDAIAVTGSREVRVTEVRGVITS